MISGGGGGGGSVRYKQPDNWTDTRYSDQISRSARRDGPTTNNTSQQTIYNLNECIYIYIYI